MRQQLKTYLMLMAVVLLSGCLGGQSKVNNCDFSSRGMVYFGLSKTEGGIVSEVSAEEWASFVSNEITGTFPSGFTLLDAQGGWAGSDGFVREASKLLIVLSDGSDLQSRLKRLANKYRIQFSQEAVLIEVEDTCASSITG